MSKLSGKVAIVGGASRGGGRGIALALGESGATVYCAARTIRHGPRPPDSAPGTVEDTAEEVSHRGGKGIPVQADLSREEDIENLFTRVKHDEREIHVVVNAAWDTDLMNQQSKRFWELDNGLWKTTASTLNSYWYMTAYATRAMLNQPQSLIVLITDNYWTDPHEYRGIDLGHEFLNRLIAVTSEEVAKRKVTIVGLNPGFMRTERVRMQMTTDQIRKQFRYDLSESPEYVGRAVAALAADPNVHKRNGELLWTAKLAEQYGFTDIDGRYIPMFNPKSPLQPFPD